MKTHENISQNGAADAAVIIPTHQPRGCGRSVKNYKKHIKNKIQSLCLRTVLEGKSYVLRAVQCQLNLVQ